MPSPVEEYNLITNFSKFNCLLQLVLKMAKISNYVGNQGYLGQSDLVFDHDDQQESSIKKCPLLL